MRGPALSSVTIHCGQVPDGTVVDEANKPQELDET